MDISSVVEQVFHYSHSVVAGCKVERSGVAALQIPTVYILRGAQLLPNRDNRTVRNSLMCFMELIEIDQYINTYLNNNDTRA